MESNGDTTKHEVKINRTRRRLYEPPVGEDKNAVLSDKQPIVPDTSEGEGVKGISADKIIKKYVMFSAGTALIPIPILDMAAVTLLQLKMLKDICNLYGIEFSKEKGKSLISSLIGGLHSGLIAGGFMKVVPVIGLTMAVAPIAALSGAITYAVGKVFVMHFESGGTLLNFDLSKVKEYFNQQYINGQKVVSGLRHKHNI